MKGKRKNLNWQQLGFKNYADYLRYKSDKTKACILYNTLTSRDEQHQREASNRIDLPVSRQTTVIKQLVMSNPHSNSQNSPGHDSKMPFSLLQRKGSVAQQAIAGTLSLIGLPPCK